MTPSAVAYGRAARLLAGVLSAPAGWMAFAFVLPVALKGAVLGLRLKQAGEPVLGWSVAGVSLLGALACAVALWWLL
jgi:hypothetical protein